MIGMFKDEIGGKTLTEFVALRAKTYSFLIDSFSNEDYYEKEIINKIAKGTKKCVIKDHLNFNLYKIE